jgi:magnesium-transporting ATPase (P-type)
MKAATRLRRAGIHCRHINRISLSGKTNLALLDKTGTITKSGLEFHAVVPTTSLTPIECRKPDAPIPRDLSLSLAIAHSVAKFNGELVGDEIELRMVDTAIKLGWKFNSDLRAPIDPRGVEWETEQTFPFNHESRTMSVIVREKASGNRFAICKGSFESISSRCGEIGTDVRQAVQIHSQEGCYVLAVGMRELAENTVGMDSPVHTRYSIENGLNLIGLLLFKNEIREDSANCISQLINAGVECIMVTGDGIHTAYTVARSVGILPATSRVVLGTLDAKTSLIDWRMADTDMGLSEESLADDRDAILCITGDVFETLIASNKLDMSRVKVFARMNPKQKGDLVEIYSTNDKIVATCGDSGNDSIALSTAHVGLSIRDRGMIPLSAPFSTGNESLASLVNLVREGRAGLCTSLAAYRFLIVVGILQTFTKVVLLTQYGGYIPGFVNLYIDSILTPLLLYAILASKPAVHFAKKAPEGSLVGPEMILGASWSTFISIAFYLLLEVIVNNQSWYVPLSTSASISEWTQRTSSFDVALLVVFRCWIYVDIAAAYSYGSDHRASILRNYRLVVFGLIFLALSLFVLFTSSNDINCAFQVNCDESSNAAATSSIINMFLFNYEQIGGKWYGVINSLVFPMEIRLVIMSVLIAASVIHHIGYRVVILGPIARWIHENIGWSDIYSICACCKRRRKFGYRRLDHQGSHVVNLNDSILSAADSDSPAAEWELRRTYGKWRTPEPADYR